MSLDRVDAFARPVRRFTQARTSAIESGHALTLDGCLAMTPAGSPIAAPTRALASAIAEEWNGAGERLDFSSMTLTRMAVAVIDAGHAGDRAWRETVVGFAASDLLCFRAGAPAALADRQETAWEPLLEWLSATHGVRLATTLGVGALRQSASALDAISVAIAARDAWRVCALARAAELTGSAVLALALDAGAFHATDLWRAARVDEDFQAARWGVDEAAARRAARMEREFNAVDLWLRLLSRNDGPLLA